MLATVNETNLRSTMGDDYPGHLALLCIDHTYVNRVDVEKVINEFSSTKVVPTSFSNQLLDQKILVIYFESMLIKRNLSLSYR